MVVVASPAESDAVISLKSQERGITDLRGEVDVEALGCLAHQTGAKKPLRLALQHGDHVIQSSWAESVTRGSLHRCKSMQLKTLTKCLRAAIKRHTKPSKAIDWHKPRKVLARLYVYLVMPT